MSLLWEFLYLLEEGDLYISRWAWIREKKKIRVNREKQSQLVECQFRASTHIMSCLECVSRASESEAENVFQSYSLFGEPGNQMVGMWR